MARSFSKRMPPKARYGKLTGSISRKKKDPAVTISPPEAKGREPCRSERSPRPGGLASH